MRRTVLPLSALWICALVFAAMPVHADDAAKPTVLPGATYALVLGTMSG